MVEAYNKEFRRCFADVTYWVCGYVTSATQARFSLQGYYSGQLFKTAELSPLRPKPENYRCG